MENKTENIKKLFSLEHKTMEEIGVIYNISRERVRQILNKNFDKKERLKIMKKNEKFRKVELDKLKRIVFTCQHCGKKFTAKYIRRRFCGKECFKEYQKKNSLTPEERIIRKKEFMKKYYQNKLKLK